MLKFIKKQRVVLFTSILLLAVILPVVFLLTHPSFAQVDYGLEYATNIGLSTTDIRVAVVKIIRTILGVLGILTLIIILYGGFVWMTAAGRADRIERAKKILLNAAIGLIIILLAFAIVHYIFTVLGGSITNGGGGIVCEPGDIRGSCELCIATLDERGRWEWQYSWPGCDSILPSTSLTLTGVQTSHAGATDKDDVYWCSKVQNIFNHNINTATVSAASSDPSLIGDPLRIAANSPPWVVTDGTWQTRGNIVTFTPRDNEFTNQNTDHREHLPQSLEDTDGRFLSDCSLTASCEGTPPPDFYWNFYVGNEGDLINPYITSTYPQSSNPANPDINVSRAPIIEVNFSEPIDGTTVLDVNGVNPFPGHFLLEELDASGGNVVNTIANNILIVQMRSDGRGFTVQLEAPNLLQAFTYYRLTVQDIQDLCGNLMDPSPYIWEFATNNQVPGVASYYPVGDNNCPDTKISITFKTSMYYDWIRMGINRVTPTGSLLESWNYVLDPSPSGVTPGITSVSDANGEFRIVDAGVPFSTHYRVYEFISANDLPENSFYEIYVETDRVININGEPLTQGWYFGITDLENCVCTPYISHLSKDQGPIGECITINGSCFTGTAAQPATLSYIHFDTTNATIGPGYTGNSVVTSVPTGFNVGDRPQITLAIDYTSGNSVPPSNAREFLITAGQANGPCLWSVQPSAACRGSTGLRLLGDRFGESDSTRQVQFSPSGLATYNVPASDWANQEIKNVVVPMTTEDGEVVVQNDVGISNGIYFDTCYCGDGVIDAGEECDTLNWAGKDCRDFGWIGGNLACDTTCRFDTSDCSNAPRVVENSNCSMGCDGVATDVCYNDSNCDPGVQCLITIFPSPNPYKNETDVCLNVAISANFNTDIDPATINTTNIFIQECADETCRIGLINVPTNNPIASLRSFVLAPVDPLNPETYYKVTITTGIASLASINMEKNYTWQFKTKQDTADCPLERVYVEPHDIVAGADQDINYYALPIGPFCTVLSEADNYDWIWTNDSTPDLGVQVQELLDDSNAQVHTDNEKGTVYIKAETEEKYNRGRLTIAFDTCAFAPEICNQNCPGSVCDLIVDRCTPVINSLSPTSGPTGRWVTVQGCYFKSAQGSGHVDFDITPVDVYPCGLTWTDTQIIVAVPNSLASGNSYDVQVTDTYGLPSNTRSFNVTNECETGVPVPSTGVPGICSLNPTSGMPGDNVNIDGENFGDDIDLGRVTFEGISADISTWSNNSIDTQVPDTVSAGDNNVIASVESCPSNGFLFDVQLGNIGDPCDGNASTPACDVNHNLCWPGNFCDSTDCTCQPIANASIIDDSRFPEPGDTAECINIDITATFDQLMNRTTLHYENIQLWQEVGADPDRTECVEDSSAVWWCPISARVSSHDVELGVDDCNNADGCTVFTLSPRSPLPAPLNNNYEIHIRGGANGVKSILGGQLNTTSSPDPAISSAIMDESYYWQFSVLDEICVIDYVDIDVSFNSSAGIITRQNTSYDYFTCAGRDNCADDILPDSSSPGNQHEYSAQARDENNIPVAANYEWSESDTEDLIQVGPPTDEPTTYVTPNPVSGESIVRVTAEDTDLTDDYDYGSATAAVSVTNFMCQNPWPQLSNFPYQDDNCGGSCIDMTFSTYYCRDYGHEQDYCLGGDDDGLDCDITDPTACPDGECTSFMDDDLPALTYPGTIRMIQSGYCVAGPNHGNTCTQDSACQPYGHCYNVLKEFMFYYTQGWCSASGILCTQGQSGECPNEETCDSINDSIGIRVYNNGEHLSPSAWYQKYANQPGSYSTKEIDGYEAISSGRTNYINFAVDKDPPAQSEIYTNMFLLSYTDNYQPVTLDIYNQLLENLRFNINGIDDVRVCEPTSGAYCVKDSDCPDNDTCNAQKSKLARDVIRLGAVSEMVYHLELYRGYCSAHNNLPCLADSHCPDSDDLVDPEFCIIKNESYPTLQAGTYLGGQSVSVWDSWNQTFASLLGTNLLLDPLNEVINCESGYNEECWSQDLNRFQCNSGSHMYHYRTDPSLGSNYSIYLNMEYSNNNNVWTPRPTLGSFSTSFIQPCSPGAYNLMFGRFSGGSGSGG